MTAKNYFNGASVRRGVNTVFIPLPRELWREIEGGCSCEHCKVDGKPGPAYWDTLAVSEKKRERLADTTWVVHMPEAQIAYR